MPGRNEDGTSVNEVEWGVPDEVLCNQCRQPLGEHGGRSCGWQN